MVVSLPLRWYYLSLFSGQIHPENKDTKTIGYDRSRFVQSAHARVIRLYLRLGSFKQLSQFSFSLLFSLYIVLVRNFLLNFLIFQCCHFIFKCSDHTTNNYKHQRLIYFCLFCPVRVMGLSPPPPRAGSLLSYFHQIFGKEEL